MTIDIDTMYKDDKIRIELYNTLRNIGELVNDCTGVTYELPSPLNVLTSQFKLPLKEITVSETLIQLKRPTNESSMNDDMSVEEIFNEYITALQNELFNVALELYQALTTKFGNFIPTRIGESILNISTVSYAEACEILKVYRAYIKNDAKFEYSIEMSDAGRSILLTMTYVKDIIANKNKKLDDPIEYIGDDGCMFIPIANVKNGKPVTESITGKVAYVHMEAEMYIALFAPSESDEKIITSKCESGEYGIAVPFNLYIGGYKSDIRCKRMFKYTIDKMAQANK